MAKKTLANLSDDKRERLEKAALEEFSKYTYDEISINRIIQSIGMPRGSFYLYFNDKEDLYLYIFNKYHKLLLDFIIDKIKNSNDDITDAAKTVFEDITTYIDKGEHGILIKKFLIGLNHNIENKIFNLEFNQVNELIKVCQDKYHHDFKDIEEVKCILDMVSNTLIHHLTGYYIFNLDYDKVKNLYYRQLEIIKKGIS